MKCVHETDIGSNEVIECSNHEKIVMKYGIVPKTFCHGRCPFRTDKAEGLGDTVAKALDTVGITKKRVAAVVGGCGCDGRQQSLNEAVPYGNEIYPVNLMNAVKHLAYRVYPLAHSDSWKWNLQQIAKRWELFNGERVLAIGYDEKTVMPDAVLEYCETLGMVFDTVIRKRNRPNLREVVTWVPMLEALNPSGANCDEVVFSGHSKGVRHDVGNEHIRWWAELMYEINLDHWEQVAMALSRRLFAGAFRRFNQFTFEGNHVWHYSGTFYWFRLRDIAQRNWQHVDQFFAGTESWPGAMAQRHEGACLFADNCGDLYNHDYWKTTILPMWQQWKAQHAT